MKITYFARSINTTSTGGHSFSLDLIAKNIAEQGNEVTIITSEPEKNNISEDVPYEIKGLGGKTRFSMAYRIYKSLESHDRSTDIYHIFQPAFHPIAGYYKKKGGATPVVGRLNGYAMFCTNYQEMNSHCHANCSLAAKYKHDKIDRVKKPLRIPEYSFRNFLGPKLASNLDTFFALSPAVKQIYSKKGIGKQKIKIMPNFYDPSFSSDDLSINSSEGLNILYVGRLSDEKGVDILIKSIEKLQNNSSFDFECNIIGDGPQYNQLSQMVSKKSLERRTNLHGALPYNKLPNYYADADIFVHPGRWPEPFGRTILESMQYETPLIVSDTGGPPWIVGDAGLTFSPSNVEDLYDKLITILSNEKKRKEMSDECEDRIQKFSPDRILDNICSEYQELH